MSVAGGCERITGKKVSSSSFEFRVSSFKGRVSSFHIFRISRGRPRKLAVCAAAEDCRDWKIVITSEARDLLSATRGRQQIPRFARDDNLLLRAPLGLHSHTLHSCTRHSLTFGFNLHRAAGSYVSRDDNLLLRTLFLALAHPCLHLHILACTRSSLGLHSHTPNKATRRAKSPAGSRIRIRRSVEAPHYRHCLNAPSGW